MRSFSGVDGLGTSIQNHLDQMIFILPMWILSKSAKAISTVGADFHTKVFVPIRVKIEGLSKMIFKQNFLTWSVTR
jgi:hypothetical protein